MRHEHHSDSKMRIAKLSAIIITLCAAILASFQPLIAQNRQLTLADILIALRSKKAEIDEKNRLLTDAVKQRGITFSLTPEIEKELDLTGARLDLIAAIRSKAAPAPVANTKQADVPKVVAPPKVVEPPQDFAFFSRRAGTRAAAGENEAAVNDLSKALEFKPQDVQTLWDRSRILLKLGKAEEAMSDLNKAVSLDVKNPKLYAERAALLEKSGKMDAAVADFEKAFELDSTDQSSQSSATRIRNTLSAAAVKAPPVVKAPATPATVSVGPLNPYATALATPVYTAMDRRMNLFGRVTVQIALDETGKVISAEASEGAKSLRTSAEEAARRSKFRPIKIGDTPVKATGFIVYNFVNQ